MRTSRPFSSISYNTTGFLKKQLTDLVKKREIAFAAFIEHHPEEDEKRAHIHCLVVPNCRLDTDALRDLMLEPDTDPEKPMLGWMPCRNSSWQDWYLYAIHHSGYLSLKRQARKYHYSNEDMWVTDELYFKDLIDHIDWTKINLMGQIIDAAKEGWNFANFLEHNNIPLQSFTQAERLWRAVINDETFRGERESHDAAFFDAVAASGDVYDAISGEVVSLPGIDSNWLLEA